MSDDQHSLEAITNVDQLLQLLYPEYKNKACWKKAWRKSRKKLRDFLPTITGKLRLKQFLYHTSSVILEEIQRTSCQPREMCVEVSKEYPESTSQFYLPRCVALHRCGGCCTNEAFYCTNTSYSFVNKTLMELSPPRMDRSVVMVTFINHTSCECLPKRPLHSIIRRAVTDHLRETKISFYLLSTWPSDELESGLLALCGPNRVLQDSSCECVCRNGLTEDSCDVGWRLDHNTCQGEGKWCPAGQRWDEDLCGCVCAADCPGNQPLNPDTCLCECRESAQSCLRQGKRFNPNTCSCYRLPCRKPRRVCPAGFYYSHQVCQCIPKYMRPKWS
uniref:Platelet-derived growth factor (PDGF) family profile domain-containing protein n=1 Tax=Echeneis naucrates TaxID=173247 RepID=A0A665WGZ8_ECHNA